MNQRPVRTTFGVVFAILIWGLPVAAGGLYFGVPLVTLDLSTTLAQLPVAVDEALGVLEGSKSGCR
jgi:hypothetical protein